MGVAGSAWATVIARVFMAVVAARRHRPARTRVTRLGLFDVSFLEVEWQRIVTAVPAGRAGRDAAHGGGRRLRRRGRAGRPDRSRGARRASGGAQHRQRHVHGAATAWRRPERCASATPIGRRDASRPRRAPAGRPSRSARGFMTASALAFLAVPGSARPSLHDGRRRRRDRRRAAAGRGGVPVVRRPAGRDDRRAARPGRHAHRRCWPTWSATGSSACRLPPSRRSAWARASSGSGSGSRIGLTLVGIVLIVRVAQAAHRAAAGYPRREPQRAPRERANCHRTSERLFTPRFFLMCSFTFTVFLSVFQLIPDGAVPRARPRRRAAGLRALPRLPDVRVRVVRAVHGRLRRPHRPAAHARHREPRPGGLHGVLRVHRRTTACCWRSCWSTASCGRRCSSASAAYLTGVLPAGATRRRHRLLGPRQRARRHGSRRRSASGCTATAGRGSARARRCST